MRREFFSKNKEQTTLNLVPQIMEIKESPDYLAKIPTEEQALNSTTEGMREVGKEAIIFDDLIFNASI